MQWYCFIGIKTLYLLYSYKYFHLTISQQYVHKIEVNLIAVIQTEIFESKSDVNVKVFEWENIAQG